ncbi:ONEC2 protein, partial [Machaerirhynchus nigripectus]|nr:ONEC2 protein [Machaerirhynchus nigripectus]
RPAMVPSMASLLDGAAEYRPELSIPLHHAMSVPCEASPPGMGMSGTYTTLTPLQPLPPISAVSDNLYGPYKEVPAVGQSLSPLGNGLGPLPGAQQGLHGYGPPGHDKMLSPNFEAHAAMLARGEQHLPRGLGTPPAMLPPLNGAHHPAPPPGCAARRERDADPLLGSNGNCKLLSSLPAPAGILSVCSRMKVPRSVCGRGVGGTEGVWVFCRARGDVAFTNKRVSRGKSMQIIGWQVPKTQIVSETKISLTCKRKEQEPNKERNNSQKKSRLVFTDLQRRTLFAIFKENKRPSKEMQMTISQQLGLELTTVSNFFMNARRRSLEKWQDDLSSGGSSSAPSTCTKA